MSFKNGGNFMQASVCWIMFFGTFFTYQRHDNKLTKRPDSWRHRFLQYSYYGFYLYFTPKSNVQNTSQSNEAITEHIIHLAASTKYNYRIIIGDDFAINIRYDVSTTKSNTRHAKWAGNARTHFGNINRCIFSYPSYIINICGKHKCSVFIMSIVFITGDVECYPNDVIFLNGDVILREMWRVSGYKCDIDVWFDSLGKTQQSI